MPEYSYWIIFGLILIIGEFVVSGLVLIFLGLAAVIVGGLAYFWPDGSTSGLSASRL